MRKQLSVAQIILWLFVVTLGIENGAGLYETFVIVPLWASSAPDSVIAFYQHNANNPQLAINAGGRFWMFATPMVGLLSLATLFSGWRTNPEHRRWRLAGAGLAFFVIAFTFAWFVPNILFLQSKEVLTMHPDDLRNLANWWVALNWGRVVLAIAAWLLALRALSIPSKNVVG